MSVITVTKKMNKEDLGITSTHEHVCINMECFFTPPEEISLRKIAYEPITMDKLGILRRNPLAVKDNISMMDEQTQINELMHFKKAGGSTVVDATTIGLGRDTESLLEASVKTGLNIIAGAGFYVDASLSGNIREMTTMQMEEQIVKEIEKGIGHTKIRAGIIGEIGISHIMFPLESQSLTAACRAQKQTGAPLMVHINPWSTMGIEAMEIIDRYSVDHSKVVICHVDVENHKDYINRLLDSGVYIEFDNFGKEMFVDKWNCKPGWGRFMTDWERVILLKKLFEKGYENQLLFSTDVCLKTLLHTYGGWGYDHIITHIVPLLEEVGVKSTQIKKVLVDNPSRWLDF